MTPTKQGRRHKKHRSTLQRVGQRLALAIVASAGADPCRYWDKDPDCDPHQTPSCCNGQSTIKLPALTARPSPLHSSLHIASGTPHVRQAAVADRAAPKKQGRALLKRSPTQDKKISQRNKERGSNIQCVCCHPKSISTSSMSYVPVDKQCRGPRDPGTCRAITPSV